MQNVYLGIALAPLFGALIAGLFGRKIGRAGAHWVTIIGVAIASFILSLLVPCKHHCASMVRSRL
jgi:NADH-quinone oxidoreductase subunit L